MKNKKRTTIQLVIWIGSISVVIGMGLYYLPKEYGHLGFWESLYITLRLFVFERDLPFPKLKPLIFIFFAAPLITASAIGTFISYLFRLSPSLRRLWISDHIVICGVGRTGKLLAQALKQKKQRVVGIDLGSAEEFEAWSVEYRVPMIFGNFHSVHLLERAAAKRARTIIYASGDDIQNLEGAITAYEWMRSDKKPWKLIWTHIANEKLANTARITVRTEGTVGIRFFDTYRIAATKMIDKYFSREQRRGVSEISILGFGKFGRDLMEILVDDLTPQEEIHLRVVDIKDRRSAVISLAEDLKIADRVIFIQADIQDLHLVNDADKAFFLCTDDDMGNLIASMMLTNLVDAPHIYVRMAHWPISTVAEHIGEERGITFVNINDLVIRGIGGLPGIFQPACPLDLKRIIR